MQSQFKAFDGIFMETLVGCNMMILHKQDYYQSNDISTGVSLYEILFSFMLEKYIVLWTAIPSF